MKVKQYNIGCRNICKTSDWVGGGLKPKTAKTEKGAHKNVLKIPIPR
jgi:hypothetical protein